MKEESKVTSVMKTKDLVKNAKPSLCIDVQMNTDTNGYLVDKFTNTATKSKQATFQSIDSNLNTPSARCSTFCTFESQHLVWITVFANRCYQLLNINLLLF